ncbi:DNA adenine methylase [bacterium]|nr:DNA adenine methylase [bacterium]
MTESSAAIRVSEVEVPFVDPHPFLKWAGGKRQLLPEILYRVPDQFGTYFEPFLGGGAVFFALSPKRAVLSDLNRELIGTYSVIRDELDLLLDWLPKYKYEKEEYYRIRALDRAPEFQFLPEHVRAARVIYLNRTCFNGLYRVNSSGYFNTPIGKYKNPKIVDEENLRACSQALQGATLSHRSFDAVLDEVKKGDFVYLDPPYPPLSASADFTNYTEESFSWDDQVRLREFCVELDRKGAFFLLSNAGIPPIQELYDRFTVEEILAKRAINSKSDRRGEVCEVLVRNY